MNRRILVLLVAALLLLAGCGGDPDPAVVADPTPSTSPASPVIESSAPPAAETPEAFIRRLVMLDTEMQNLGETNKYRAVSSACDACTKTADQVDEFYAAGGAIKLDGQSVESIELVGGQTYKVKVVAGPTSFTRSANGPRETFPGGPTIFKMTLQLVGGGWQIERSSRLAQ